MSSLRATSFVSFVALVGGCGRPAAPVGPAPSVAAPVADAGATQTKACDDASVPAGEGGACVKSCQADADCKKGERCVPTSWDMGGGQMAHDNACF